MVNITPTHLKHLESEHRKPSIEVLFNISQILHLSLDDILFDNTVQTTSEYHKAEQLLKQCNTTELKIISDIIKSLISHRK